MFTRILLTLTVASMMVIATAGCSSASYPSALAPTGTPALRSSLTPPLPRAPRVGDVAPDFVKVAALQQRLGLTYPILVDDHFKARTSYQITDVPLAYFLDRQHVIRSIVAGSLNETVLHKQASSVEG